MTDPNSQPTHDAQQRAKEVRAAIGMITEEELAAVLLLHGAGTLATWRGQKKGPDSVRLGKRVFYSVAGLAAWVNKLHQEQNAPPCKALPDAPIKGAA